MSWIESQGYVYDPDGNGPVEEQPGNRGWITFWPIDAVDADGNRIDAGVGLHERAERIDVAMRADGCVLRLPRTPDTNVARELAQKLLEADRHRKELYGEL